MIRRKLWISIAALALAGVAVLASSQEVVRTPQTDGSLTARIS
jgi:hypothetical protein